LQRPKGPPNPPAQRCSTITAHKSHITPSPETSFCEAVGTRLLFDREDRLAEFRKKFGRHPVLRSGLHKDLGADGDHDFLKQLFAAGLTIERGAFASGIPVIVYSPNRAAAQYLQGRRLHTESHRLNLVFRCVECTKIGCVGKNVNGSSASCQPMLTVLSGILALTMPTRRRQSSKSSRLRQRR
jgi:hypothetical protein